MKTNLIFIICPFVALFIDNAIMVRHDNDDMTA